MKRTFVALLALLVMVSSLNVNVIADSNIREAPEVKVMINGKLCAFIDVPIKIDISIFLPLRELLVGIGVQNDDEHIIWNKEEDSFTIIKDSTKIIIKPGVATANINGSDVKLGAAPIRYKEKLYVHVEFVKRCFDKPVKWEADTSTLMIERASIGDVWASKRGLPISIEPGSTSTVIKGENGSITRLVQYDNRSGKAVVLGSKLYVINGIGEVAEYDPETDTWTVKKDISAMKGSKGQFKLVAINDKIYIVGNNYNEILEYDPVTNKIALITKLTADRKIGGAAVVNGKIYVMGGCDINGVNDTDIVEEYDIAANKWTTKSRMLSPSHEVTLAVVNNIIYRKSSNIEEYNPATDQWTSKAKLPYTGMNIMLEVANGKVYLVNAESSSSKVMEYDPIFDKWSAKNSSVPRPRMDACTAALNGKIYIIGGRDDMFADLSREDWKKRFDDLMNGNAIRGTNYVDEYTAPIYMD